MAMASVERASVEFVGIAKSFPGVQALSGVDLTLQSGRIHALVGENGAGKSTLLGIIAGIHQPDSGEMRFRGRPVRWSNPAEARRAGIVIVHQEVELFPDLSVAENVGWLSGMPTRRFGLVDWSELHRRTETALKAVGERLSPRTLAGELSPAQRQMVEIAAAICQSASLLIFDEPTSSLSDAESRTLFTHIRGFRDQGSTVVYVSHRLEEVFALADDLTVLRDGMVVWSGPVAATSPDEVIQHMVGRRYAEAPPRISRPTADPQSVRFRCHEVSANDGSCRNASLEVRAGEILCLYGLIGSGRTEWAQVVLGLRAGSARCEIDGQPAAARRPEAWAKRGLVYVPEDRFGQGLCRGQSVRFNAAMASWRAMSVGFWLPWWRESALARRVIERFGVRCASANQPIATLSGGNQQKVILGRWWVREPAVLILDEPTRGVDVAAKRQIHDEIRRFADAGRAVIVISSDLPEVVALADRVGVFREGQLVAVHDAPVDAHRIATAALPSSDPIQGTERDQVARPATKAKLRGLVRNLPREAGLLLVLLVLIGILEIRTDRFLTQAALGNLLSDSILLGCVACGAALVIIAGGIDISLGSLMALSAAIAGGWWQQGAAWPAVFALAVLVGTTGGLTNALLAYGGRIHPIVVTLGTMSVYRGLTRWWLPQDIHIPGSARNALFGEGDVLPPVIWFGLGGWLALSGFLSNSLFGRRLFAVGGRPEAARRLGLSPTRTAVAAYALQGAFAGLGGILFLARSGSLQPTSYEDKTLQAISAVVVGGVAITGGRGSMLGVLLGCALLVLLTMACHYLRLSTDWQQAVTGAVLVLAVLSDRAWRRSE